MKDSYDQLDWQNGETAKGYTHYSQNDYDSFAQNPTYRNEFYDEAGSADTYQESYDQSYDSTYQDGYDQSYDNGYYDQNYYDENGQYYDDGSYQQTNSYNDPYYAAPPTQYSQADYDKYAQHPTYNTEDHSNKMNEDQFFAMIDQQKRNERRRDMMTNIALIGTPFQNAVRSDPTEVFSKDTLLFFVFCAFGCGLARLFNLPFWAYPMFAGAVAYIVSIIKKLVIDEYSFKDALKACIIEGVVVGLGIIGSIYLYSKGF